MTISISDLSPVTSESLLASIKEEEGGVIKSAVARALAARQVVGGLTKIKPIVEEPVVIEEPIDKEPLIIGKLAYPICPPIVVGLIAYPDDFPTLETV